jgi:tRNA dimethylallyltransferase
VKVVFVVGPTASGKSDLALSWAEKFGGAILNCDSIQLFKSLDIGSAKPSAEEFKRVPHFLFDYVEEGADATAGQFSRDFFATLENIKTQFPVVFVVGGTGFYFQAIEKGMYPIGAADPKVIALVEQELRQNPVQLYEELLQRDPETAQKISPNDHYRLARAVEMMRTHGRAVSEIKKEFEASRAPFPYPLLKIGIASKKENLLPRVQLRTRKMLERGLVAEVQSLLAKGLAGWSALQSVGYKECVDYLEGRLENQKALEDLIVQNTMRLAKKQRTWFQRDTEIIWIENSEAERGSEKIQEFLSDSSASVHNPE